MEAKRVELPPELILAVIEVESNFDRYAVSVAGALGLMQIMPFWLEEIGRPDDNLLHTDTNLRYGCTILRFYLRQGKWRSAARARTLQRQPRQAQIPEQGDRQADPKVVSGLTNPESCGWRFTTGLGTRFNLANPRQRRALLQPGFQFTQRIPAYPRRVLRHYHPAN